MANLIPAAGAGARFARAGYALPKPLIPVDGAPMIRRAMQALPPQERWVVVCQKEHVDKFGLDQVIKKDVPGAVVVTVEGVTEGQAMTCMKARPFLDPAEPVLVGACDAAPRWDPKKLEALIRDRHPDAVVFTFRHDPRLVEKPASFGWVQVDARNQAQRISVKVPISQDPFNDHAIVGYFYFRTAQTLWDAIERMVKKGHRTNQEFYLDGCAQGMIEHGQRVLVFEVEEFIGWGTPEELEAYGKRSSAGTPRIAGVHGRGKPGVVATTRGQRE